jgi:ABC-type uncharacterized transport system ATPase subunit
MKQIDHQIGYKIKSKRRKLNISQSKLAEKLSISASYLNLIESNTLIMLKIDKLSKSFGGILATDNVSLELKPNSINAVIGPNGAGKTTLFNLITGKISIDAGQIFIDNINITNLKESEIIQSLNEIGNIRNSQLSEQ